MDGACGGDEPCDDEIVGLMENGQTTGISECLGGVGEATCRLRLVWRPETIFTVCVMTFNRWTSLWWRERVLDAGSRILPEINLDSCSFSGDLQPPEIPDCVVPTQT